jgi:DNA-binding FadR family transcriptional regulator
MKNFTTTTLADHAEQSIMDYIRDNNLTPGDSLPNEMYFSENLGISRNSVREAISRLRMLGLIQSRTKRGMIVSEPPLLSGFQRVVDPRLFSIDTIKNMMGMRIALEIGITDFIFDNLRKEHIERLEIIVSKQHALGANFMTVESEKEFHHEIYRIAGNEFIMQFQEIMQPVFEFAKMHHEKYLKPLNDRLSGEGRIVTHDDLFELIKVNNREGYREAVRDHLGTYALFIKDSH